MKLQDHKKIQIFLEDYYKEYSKNLNPKDLFDKLINIKEVFEKCSEDGGKLIFGGNGASSSIASHAALDFTKQAKIKSTTFHDPALITAFSNDYGYKNYFSEAVKAYADKKDVLVLISVSGESPNMVRSAEYAKSKGIITITLTGKNSNNTLRNLGDINLWVDSQAYNIVEGLHMIWITTIVDMIIGKSVYSVS